NDKARGDGFCVGARDWELDALVLPDRPSEHNPHAGIVGGAANEKTRIAQTYGRDQNAHGVHAVDDVAEALSLFAYQVLRRDLQVVDEHLAGVVIDHRVDLAELQAVALGFPQIDDEDGEAFGPLVYLVGRCGSRQKQHEVRLHGPARPDFLAGDDVAVALFLSAGLELGGIAAGRRLGYAESLQTQLA